MLSGSKTGLSGVVLVADDEPSVLRSVACILRYAGYTVLEAASAEVALCLGRGYEGAIDLLLADVLMPRMNGAALADRFAALHPETRYLFMAGLPNHPEVVAGVLERGRPFLPKPFPLQQLLQRVAEVLVDRTLAAKSGR